METALMLFTRDLRVGDNPALAAACAAAESVVPLYVDDPTVSMNANRRRFLAQALADLHERLGSRGAGLVVGRGDPVEEAVRVCSATGAGLVTAAEDAGRAAVAMRRRLAEACRGAGVELRLLPGVTVVPARSLRPSGGGDHYRVFTPYWRAWSRRPERPAASLPDRIGLPEGVVATGPEREAASTGAALPAGGESAGLARLEDWLRREVDYAAAHDDLAADATSRLSPYLAFGCLSARALAADPRVDEAMVRQLCWRDFHHQVLAAFPDLTRRPYRRGSRDEWVDDPQALARWREGRTGLDIVDAGMRQLVAEGWMPNRARLIAAGYLVKTLGLDWRAGADRFAEHLVDLDEANNWGNWQWVAGTGNDTRPNRGFNAERQAARFDPDRVWRDRWLGRG